MLENDKNFYKICFDTLLEGICITDNKGKIVLNNSPLEEIFGYEKGELLNKNIDLLIPKKYHKSHQDYYKTYFKNPIRHKKGKGREFLGLHKNGNIIQLEIGLNHFTFNDKVYAKALISDISWRKKDELKIKNLNIGLEKEVEKQTKELNQVITKLKDEIQEKILAKNKAKIAFQKEKELNLLQTKFLSLVSHEFKTPLSGILTSISLIEKYNESIINENIQNHAFKIKKLVFQLNSVLDDFLFLEKTETKDLKYQLTKFNFCEFIDEIIENSRSVLKKGQTIKLTPCDSKIEVIQDKKIVDIIIRNVLFNSIKYSPENSNIKINITNNSYLKIIVQDNGIGIPKKDQKHIFERFFRAKNALHFQGTGIGLNIVKHHIEELKGSIKFISEEKKGSTFTIKLPLIMKL